LSGFRLFFVRAKTVPYAGSLTDQIRRTNKTKGLGRMIFFPVFWFSPTTTAYLCRRTSCHSRQDDYLEEHLHLLMCYYNLIRPHRSLKFGRQVRTPAMQAGLVSGRFSFRDVLSRRIEFFLCVFLVILITRSRVAKRARYCSVATVA